MKKRQKKQAYTDGPILIGKEVPDFLPSPEELKKAKTKVYHEDGSYTIYEARDEERKK